MKIPSTVCMSCGKQQTLASIRDDRCWSCDASLLVEAYQPPLVTPTRDDQADRGWGCVIACAVGMILVLARYLWSML